MNKYKYIITLKHKKHIMRSTVSYTFLHWVFFTSNKKPHINILTTNLEMTNVSLILGHSCLYNNK